MPSSRHSRALSRISSASMSAVATPKASTQVWWMFSSGANQSFQDKSLTQLQTLVGIALIILAPLYVGAFIVAARSRGGLYS